MAKKSFGVRSSMSVQPKQISPDEVEKAIQKIHQPEEKQEPPKTEKPPAKAKSKPAAKKSTPRKKKAAPKEEVSKRKVRLSVDVTPDIHKRLKIRAIQNDSDIMRYVAMLIERDLNKKQTN